ncbi:LysR family transcriptional regulator [Consotaella aegiceratis]|uniref:LysR family transcriptional regulator n=1 Tax=Consotaella aegiceratis TaxID=3097961 RepID=UPI002F4162D2
MRFTFRQLEYFLAAAQSGSITQASERINISQPSISTAISQLEQEMGLQLFVRHHAQGLSLTPAGRKMFHEVKRLLEQAEGLYGVASEASEEVRGTLNVGCLTTLAPMILPELSVSFNSAFPKAQVRPDAGHQQGLLEGLTRATIDIAITYDLQIPPGIEFLPLAKLPVHALLGESDVLARHSSVSLKELAALPLILLDLPLSREYFLALFMKEGLQPNIAYRFTQPDIIRTMVANSYGYTLANVLPRSDTALDGRKVVRVKLSGEHQAMTIGLATLKDLRKSRLVKAFVNHATCFISPAYIPGMVAPTLSGPGR